MGRTESDKGGDKPDGGGRVERLDEEDFEARLRAAASGLFPDRVIDDLEFRHLVRVMTETPLLLSDVYSDDRIRRIMRPSPGALGSLIDQLEEVKTPYAALRRVRRLPEDVRVVGDKALFDLSLLGLQQVKGFDLGELGARAYRVAGEVLELLAEDRRLRKFFKENQLLMLPLEEEVVFLRQCSERFHLYADLLKHLHRARGADSGGDIAELVTRLPLMAAAAEALTDEPAPETDGAEDDYLAAAHGESRGDSLLTRERLISGYERMLLFSSLRMDGLAEALAATVIDQPRAISALCDDFSLFATGTRDPRKPPAYFMVGPTGVGKNHLVESVARLLGGVWEIDIPMLTIEGPNYTYPSDINELRGATRGFIRSDEDGLLTSFHEKTSRAPLGILLVDEVEKAHPQLLTFFLSILDRGTTTDNRGTVLNFANCMIFFTSNLGYSDSQQGSAPIGYGDEMAANQAADQSVRRELRGRLRPEFINRVRMVHFDRLTRASVERILDLELERIARRYRQLHGLDLELDGSARDELIRRGYSPAFGARHLASTLESVCNVEIAKRIQLDDTRDDRSRRSLIQWLREMRAGTRPFTEQQVRERVTELSRARLPYDRLKIVFAEGRFEYLPQ